MEKKDYVKPSMKVVKYQQHGILLYSDGNGGEGYIPGMAPEEQNKLA